MEPNKMEQQIKNKLEGRTIQPSAKSWDRLDAMLAVEEKPKKKTFVWFYIAASLFFVFGITYWFVNLNSTEIIIPQNTIVTTEGEDSLESNETESSNKNEIVNELIEQVQPINNSVAVQNQEPKNVKLDKKIKRNNPKGETVIQNQIIEKNEIIVENNKPVYISPEKLLASVENNQQNSSITNSNKTKSSVKVDANSLLSSVESEITEEYRETTFDKLKRKFDQAKTAVVNRNYE